MALVSSSDRCLIICDECFREITYISRINCACGLDLCPKCFHLGVEAPNHGPEDNYFAIEPLNFEISPGWTAFEQLLFIDALSALGIGNWAEISDFIKTKTKEQIEEHFFKMVGMDYSSESEEVNLTADSIKPQSPIYSNFLPYRKEFEAEYNFSYEHIIRDIEPDDPNFELLMDMYFDLQKFRNLRKFVIIEHDLIKFAWEETLMRKQLEPTTDESDDKSIVSENNLLDNVAETKISDKEGEDDNKIFYLIRKKLLPMSVILSRTEMNKLYRGLCSEYLLSKKISQWDGTCDYLEIERLRKKMLSSYEVKLCNVLNVTYKSYLRLKAHAIFGNLKVGHVKYESLGRIVKLEERVKIIYNYFVYNKWINRA